MNWRGYGQLGWVKGAFTCPNSVLPFPPGAPQNPTECVGQSQDKASLRYARMEFQVSHKLRFMPKLTPHVAVAGNARLARPPRMTVCLMCAPWSATPSGKIQTTRVGRSCETAPASALEPTSLWCTLGNAAGYADRGALGLVSTLPAGSRLIICGWWRKSKSAAGFCLA